MTMENSSDFDPETPRQHILERAVGVFIAGIGFVKRQLSTADLNPHEGKLRSSLIDEKYMGIPDYPPIHDDTI